MKKITLDVSGAGLAFAVQGCGFDPTIDSSVMIVKLPQHRRGSYNAGVTPTPGSNSNTGGYHRTDSQWSQCEVKEELTMQHPS
ncbi:MAG: hypothetical protein ACLUTA_13110 [Blautia wexlerae]